MEERTDQAASFSERRKLRPSSDQSKQVPRSGVNDQIVQNGNSDFGAFWLGLLPKEIENRWERNLPVSVGSSFLLHLIVTQLQLYGVSSHYCLPRLSSIAIMICLMLGMHDGTSMAGRGAV